MYILGIHGSLGGSSHDSAAAIIKDDSILAAAEEERFVRYKHALGLMPDNAIRYCLKEAGINMHDVDVIAFPRASWADFDERFKAYLWYNFGHVPKIEYVDHHTSHAASAYLISGFDESLVITLDQSGDGVSCSAFMGHGTSLTQLNTVPFPHSIGLFASYITQYLGFRSNHDEYKVMGLASYGNPTFDLSPLLDSKEGIPRLDIQFLHPETLRRHPIAHTAQLPMFKDEPYDFMPRPRKSNEPILDIHKDLAASAQKTIEDVSMSYILKYKNENTRLCIAGGVAENSVLNGKIAESEQFSDIYVAPIAGDAGTALGAALYVGSKHGYRYQPLTNNKLGTSYSNDSVQDLLTSCAIPFTASHDIARDTAKLLASQKIVAWFQGRMEFGPRALGARSLLADPSNEEMKRRVNSIKRREQFRPFAPSILEEQAHKFFETNQASPFMSFTLETTALGREKLLGATHVDHTGRLQTVPDDKSIYRQLIEAFYELTGVPALLNTSLNSGWEPIVESPAQALAFFYSSEADVLVLNDYIITK